MTRKTAIRLTVATAALLLVLACSTGCCIPERYVPTQEHWATTSRPLRAEQRQAANGNCYMLLVTRKYVTTWVLAGYMSRADQPVISIQKIDAAPKELTAWHLLLFPLFRRSVSLGPSIWTEFILKPSGELVTADKEYDHPEDLAENVVAVADKYIFYFYPIDRKYRATEDARRAGRAKLLRRLTVALTELSQTKQPIKTE